MPKIRFLKAHAIWMPGNETDTIDFPIAEQLVKRGVAEWVDEPECAMVEPPRNAMKKRPRKRKKRT